MEQVKFSNSIEPSHNKWALVKLAL